MDIEGTITADLTKAAIVYNQSNDGNSMLLDLDLTLDKDQALELVDEDFAETCFSGLHQATEAHEDGDETVWRFGYSTKQPPKWMVCQVHKVDLWGTKEELQPVIKKFTAGGKDAAVTVWVRFEVPVGDDAGMIGALGCKVGQQVKIKLGPKNPRLKLKARKAG